MDAAYRTDLREFNEINFARFDAKLEQRLAQSEARMEQRLSQSEARMEQRITDLRAELLLGIAKLETKMEAALRDQTRFFFLAWVALLASNIALWFRS